MIKPPIPLPAVEVIEAKGLRYMVFETGDMVGQILRRNIAYGDVREHGTLFVGMCARQQVLHEMLERMLHAHEEES